MSAQDAINASNHQGDTLWGFRIAQRAELVNLIQTNFQEAFGVNNDDQYYRTSYNDGDAGFLEAKEEAANFNYYFPSDKNTVAHVEAITSAGIYLYGTSGSTNYYNRAWVTSTDYADDEMYDDKIFVSEVAHHVAYTYKSGSYGVWMVVDEATLDSGVIGLSSDQYTPTVPVPASLGLLGLALAGMSFRRKKA